MSGKRDDKEKAEVLALARMGNGSPSIAEETNLPARTVRQWITDAKRKAESEGRDPLLVDGEYRIGFLTQDLTEQALVALKESDEPLYKYLLQLNATRGTAFDKTVKGREASPTVNVEKMFIITNAQKPDIIEGEVVDN